MRQRNTQVMCPKLPYIVNLLMILALGYSCYREMAIIRNILPVATSGWITAIKRFFVGDACIVVRVYIGDGLKRGK